jgi:hypothetical protein
VTDAPSDRPALADTCAYGQKRTFFIDRTRKQAARNARNATIAAGWDWGLSESIIDDLVSIVDALTVNAIIHANWIDEWPAVPVVIELVGPRVIVEVRDPDPTLPVWPTGRPFDIVAMLNDPDVKPDDDVLIHHQGLVDVAGRAELSALVESVGKVVRAVVEFGATR